MFNFRKCAVVLVVYLLLLVTSVFSQTVGLWHADEGSGNVLGDSSSNDYDFDDVGTGSGSDYSWATGYLEDGLVASIDSNSHLRTTIDSNKLCYQATVEAWIKPTSLDSDGSAIVSLYNGFTLHFGASHEDLMRFVCYVNGTWQVAGVSGGVKDVFFDGSWHHVVGVYDGIPNEGKAHIYLYWDGQLVATTEIATSLPLPIGNSDGTTGTTLCIGTNAWYYNDNPNVYQHYRGAIDEIKISDTAINFADVNVVGRWHMDEGSGSYAYDSSINCYDFNSVGTGNGSNFSWDAGYDIHGLSTPNDNSSSYLMTTICPNDICYQATVEAWIKPTALEDNDGTQIVSLLNAFGLHFGADHEDLIRFVAYANGIWPYVQVSSGVQATMMDGNWHHVAGVYDGIPDSNNHAHMYMYWDGILVATTEIDTSSPLPIGNSNGTTGSVLCIGANAWFYDNPNINQHYKGSIDEVSILNSVPENPDRFDSLLSQNKIDFKNDFYSCKLSTSKNFFGLANLKFDSIDHNSPVDYLSDQDNTAFFKVLGENLYIDSNNFVVDDLVKDQQSWGDRWTISLSCPGRKLAAVLTVDVNSSTDEMLWGLQVKNRSGFPRKLQVIFPVLGSFNIDNNLIDNYYYYPFESGLNGKIDCNMIAEYGNFAWMQLVSVYDPNSNAAIYAYPKDDSGGFKGIVLKKLFDGETPTVNNDCALLTREKPNMADVNKPIDVLDDVNDGIAFAYYYPMREIAAYHNYSYPKTVVRIYDGGWREALENYSCWVHSWYTPLNTPQWYKRCFFFGGQWDDEFYDDVNDTYVTSQSLQGHEDIIEWALWHDYNDVNLTAAQGLEAYQFGDYYYPQDRGGLTPMKDEIEACKDLGCQIMLYLSCRFCWTGTDTGLAYGQGWAAMFEPGTYTYNGGITTEKWLECQYEPNAWPDYIAEISGQIIADTCAVAFYIDEMPLSFPCYNPNHVHYQEDKFPCSADRMHQYINNLTSAVRAENSQAIVMGEYVGSEYLMQYFDGSWDQKYNGWSFTAPYYGEDSLNYFRFYFPEFKLALLGGADSDIDQRVLFNGIGVAGSSTAIIIGGGVLKENADAFSSLHLKPLIPTKVDRVLANEFSNDVNDKTVYTIYNKSGSDVNTSIIDVPHRSNYHYVELYYDTNNIVATQTDGNDTLTFAIDVNEVLCIAQLQQIIQATRNGPVISISLNQTDANDYLVAFYNEDTSYTGFSDAQTITLTDGTGQINVLDTFGGWKKTILKLYRNDILFDEVIIPEPTPCLPGDVILWHLDEGSGTDSNDSESEGSYSILTLGEDYSWAAGCPNVPDSNYCLSSPSDSNSYCKSWIYPRDITAQLTLSAWIKPTSVDADGSSIVSVTNCFNLHFGNLTGDNIIRFICQAGATYPNVVVYDANATFFDDKWHQVKAVYDGVLDPNGNINLYLYIDGTLAVSSAIASGTSLPLGDSGGIGSYVYIGANAWGPDYFDSQRYRGAIDEVRLSNIAE